MPDLPLKAQGLLQQNYVPCTSTVEDVQTSSDGATTKLLIRLQDGLRIESVIMYYDTSGRIFVILSSVKSLLLCHSTDG